MIRNTLICLEIIAMAALQRLINRAQTGTPIVLDGANGSELERLGARMDQNLWCACALVDSPELVQKVHQRYMDAGADVITTNSFSATREAMSRNGLGRKFEAWNRLSVRLALEERDKSSRSEEICIAGSVSSYGRFDELDSEAQIDHFRAQASVLVDEGVDLVVLESLGSSVRTVKSMISATRDLRVPVWVSISCTLDRETSVVMFGIEESSMDEKSSQAYAPFSEVIRDIMSVGGSAILMMHSLLSVTTEAVEILRASYDGLVGAYPNAGYYKEPNWVFEDHVSPDEYVAQAQRWIEAGATIVGGCCGIGVEHIRRLADSLKNEL